MIDDFAVLSMDPAQAKLAFQVICHDAQRSAANQPGKSASHSVG
jgi:hypothetical protein